VPSRILLVPIRLHLVPNRHYLGETLKSAEMTGYPVFHRRVFLESRLSSIDPSIDLTYLTDMKIYSKEDAEAAEMVIKRS
jgi:hypothetical protein